MDLLELAELAEHGGSEGCHEMFAGELLPKDAQKDSKLYRRYRALMQGALKGSIDAVEKLCAEFVPNQYVEIEWTANGCRAEMENPLGYGLSQTECRARLAALLRAVHAERKENERR